MVGPCRTLLRNRRLLRIRLAQFGEVTPDCEEEPVLGVAGSERGFEWIRPYLWSKTSPYLGSLMPVLGFVSLC